MSESQQTNSMEEDSMKKKQRTSKENFLQEQGQSFLQRPVVKVENLNKSLKESYEKGHFKEPRFQFINQLRRIRNGKEKDSVSSQDKQDDEDYKVERVPRRKRKSNDDNEDNPGSKQQKRKGRPPKAQNAEKKAQPTTQFIVKKRGRPKGSLNKNKAEAEASKHAEAEKSKLIVSDKQESELSSSESQQARPAPKVEPKIAQSKSKQSQSESQEQSSEEQRKDKIEKNKPLESSPIQVNKSEKKQNEEKGFSSESSEEKMRQNERYKEDGKRSQILQKPIMKVKKANSKLYFVGRNGLQQVNRQMLKNNLQMPTGKQNTKNIPEKSEQQSESSYKQSEEEQSQKFSRSEEESYAPTSQKLKKSQQSKVIISKYGKHLLPRQKQRQESPEQPHQKAEMLKQLRDEILNKKEQKNTQEQIQFVKLMGKRGRRSRAEQEQVQRLSKIVIKRRQQKKEQTLKKDKEKTIIKEDNQPTIKPVTTVPTASKPVEQAQINDEKQVPRNIMANPESVHPNIEQLQKSIRERLFNEKVKSLKLNPNLIVQSISAVSPIKQEQRRLFRKWTEFYQNQKVKKRIVQSDSQESSSEVRFRKRAKKEKVQKYRKLVVKGDASSDSEDQSAEQRQRRTMKKIKRVKDDDGQVLMMKIQKEGKKNHKSSKYSKQDHQ